LIYSFSFQLYQKQFEIKYTFFKVTFLPIILIIESIDSKHKYIQPFHNLIQSGFNKFQKNKDKEANSEKNSKNRANLTLQIIFGILLSQILLLLIIPLLASVNPIFAENTVFLLKQISNIFSGVSIFRIIFGYILFLVLAVIFAALKSDLDDKKYAIRKLPVFGKIFF